LKAQFALTNTNANTKQNMATVNMCKLNAKRA